MNPEIILGPPGTGKTTTLLNIVDQELERGVSPDRIGYLSFTRKAANEAIDRACEKFGLSQRDFPHFRTLHSLCFRALGLSNGDIFEGKKMMEFGDEIGVKLTEFRQMDDTLMFGFTDGDRALFMDNLARVMCMPLKQLYNISDDNLNWDYVDFISRSLAEYKRKKSLVDFTDMLLLFAQQEWTPQIEVLLIDEAQDLSILQWRVVEKLAAGARRVVVAGDDDQAIYRWAGAAVDHFVDMDGRVQVLNQSWRVPTTIQAVSDQIIRRVRHRREKVWHPRESEGLVKTINGLEEVDLWSDDILILARNAFVLRKVERYLQNEAVLYDFRGKSSVKQSTIDIIKLWEALRRGETITAGDAVNVYSMMRTGVGVKRGYKKLPGVPPDTEVNLKWLQENGGLLVDQIWHESLTMMNIHEQNYLLKCLQKGEKLSRGPRIRLSTIHGSKGGQADHVILLTEMAKRTYLEYVANPEDEARVWYVACTRAKERLSVMRATTNLRYGI